MKKTAAFLSLIFSGFILFAENADLSFFNGTWAPEDQLPAKVKIELSYDEFYENFGFCRGCIDVRSPFRR